MPYALKKPINWDEQFSRRAPIDVEIGFGLGEVLVRMAHKSSDRDFVGIEQHWERITKTLRTITMEQSADQDALRNIRILKVDARVVFERLFASKSIDSVYCLFPCPWPKKGHVKHRLFSNNFLKLLNNRLKKNGELKIVTDFYPYCEWILEQVKHTGFQVCTKFVSSQYDTKFERKWREEGQEDFFELHFQKKRHIHGHLKEDVALKNYYLDDFNAESFVLIDTKGDISVIFKDMIFDENKQKAMIYVLVAEEHLTQHFWITIVKKHKRWCVARAEGQNFFPTAGIAKALELVYEAAKKSCCAAKVNS